MPSCTTCHATGNAPCYEMSSGGPAALPAVYRAQWHSGRRNGEPEPAESRTAAPKPPPKRRAPVAATQRRKTAGQQAQIKAWRKLAEQKGKA